MATKTKLFLLIVAVIGLASWKAIQTISPATPETGLYKVTIFYANGEGKTFDMDYYEKKHMPMVAGFIGKNLKSYEIDKGISGRTPADKPLYLAIGYFYVKDLAEYNKAIAANREAVVNDFKNYTNIQPVIQISEVKQVYPDTK